MHIPRHLTQPSLFGFFLAMFAHSAAYGQAAFVGQYVGQAKIAYSGTLNQPAASAGLVSFTVRADGTVAEIGNDLIGTINGSGEITWQTPNAFFFTTGSISGNILTASASTTSNGLTITRSVDAKLLGAQFPPGDSFTGQITDLNPVNGYGGHLDVEFLNGGFVAVGSAGAIALSDDGVTWQRSSAPTAKPLSSITYGNGTYLATSQDTGLYTSPDAVTWTKRTAPFLFNGSFGNIVDVVDSAFGNGVFVITAQFAGEHATSTDGINWTIAASKFGTQGSNIDFLNGQFVQSRSGEIRFSSDGVNWGSAVPFSVNDITFGNGKYVAANNSGLHTSPDGVTWTQRFSGNVSQVEFGNGRFVARTAGSSGSQLYSDDGETWVLASFFPSSGVQSIAHGNGRYVMAGGDLISSADGNSWGKLKRNRLVLSPVDSRSNPSGNPTLYFEKMVQTDFNNVQTLMDVNIRVGTSTSEYFAGDDGVFFLIRGSNPKQFLDLGTSEDLHAVIGNFSSLRGAYVAGGGGVIRRFDASGPGNAETYAAEVIASPTTETLRYGSHFPGETTFFVGDGGTIVSISAPEGPSPTAAIVSSGTTADLRYVARVVNNSFFGADVAVGANGTILVRNGTTGAWSAKDSGTTETLIGVSFVAPNFVAVGEDGAVVLSTDLETWTPAPRIVPPGKITRFYGSIVLGEFGFYAFAGSNGGSIRFLEGVNSLTGAYNVSASPASGSMAFGNGKYLAVGGTFSSVSADGKSWETSIIPNSMNAATFGEGKFVAVGGLASEIARDDRIFHSADGLSWIQATMPSLARPLFAVTYGSGKFIASGQRGAVMSSEDGVTWTQVGGDLSSFSNKIVALAHGNGIFVGVGGGLLIASTDAGASFSERSAGGASGLASVTIGNGTFVAVGSDGNTIRSTNGTNWSRTQIQAAQSATGSRPVFDQVAYANGNFIATTDDGQAYVSSDGGVSWSEKFTGVGTVFSGSVVANGLAVFSGQGNIVGFAIEDNSPYLISQPPSTIVNAGSPLNLSVTVSGGNPLTYQWFQNGTPLANGGSVAGADGATLTINNITPGFSGKYTVTVTNPDGSRTSAEATVTVEGSAVTGYDAWKGDFTFPPGKDGPLDDADDDGVPNLLEFVTGSHPVQPGPSLLPGAGTLTGTQIGGTADPAKSYLTFQARVRKDRPGIALIPQSGDTLAALSGPDASSLVGQVGAPVDDPGDPDFELITYYHTVAIGDSPTGAAFMRIGVSL